MRRGHLASSTPRFPPADTGRRAEILDDPNRSTYWCTSAQAGRY
jgi:hypothetical protein